MSGCRAETVEKYRAALELYDSTTLPAVEICRRCGVSLNGFSSYVRTWHRELMLRRHGVECTPEEADNIRISSARGQRPATHARYKDAIAACDSMDYISANVSEIAREFGLSGSNLARQLRVHYPGVIEFRERARQRMGLDDNLPRGAREWCKEQYAEAVELLRSNRYITVREAAERCDVPCFGLEQHLIFYHKDLLRHRVRIREEASGQQLEGEVTGSGTVHAPRPEISGKYAAAVELYRTTPMSARKIAMQTGVPVKGFYEYLHTWHKDLVAARNGRNPAAAAKYAGAIARLKEGGITIAKTAAEFGLNPDNLRQYLKEHEPELHTSVGRRRKSQ